jgi:NADH-quinone oxidoreductase subunit J
MLIAKALVAALSVFCGLGVILSPQAVHSALFLTCNLLCVAVLYLMMKFEFLGVAQMVVYAGAIMVVFLFAVTVLAPKDEVEPKWNDLHRVTGLLVASIFGSALIAACSTADLSLSSVANTPYSLKQFAQQLFGPYVFVFESTAFILLVALVAVTLLGHRRLREIDRGEKS